MPRHLLAAVSIATGAALLVITFGHGRDQGIYATVGQTILDGGAPYRDAFDFKPPGIHLLFALAHLVGDGERAIRIVEGIGLVVTAIFLVQLGERWWKAPGAGLLAAALASLNHVQLDFWHTAQPESFGGMLTIAALRVAWRGPASTPWERFACGVCFGLAGLMKPPLGAGVLAVAAWTRGSAPLLAGAALPVVACLGWLGLVGAWPAAWEIFTVVTPGYTALAWRDQNAIGLAVAALARWPSATTGGILVGLALATVGWRFVRRRRASGVLVAICLLQLAGVAMQGKLFAYHYGGLGPPAALVAAGGWWWAFRRISWVAALPCAASLAWTATPRDLEDGFWQRTARRIASMGSSTGEGSDALASVAGVNAADQRALAAWLRAHTPDDARVFIWGFEPRVYGLAERRPASAYIYNVPQRLPWCAATARERLMTELTAAPPEAIVVEHGDVFPWVTGDHLDSAAALATFPRLDRFIREGYRRETTIAAFDLYLRR